MDIISVIGNLKNMFCLKPATDEQIESAEKELGLKFAQEYKTYLKEYGVISAKGIELTGICESERLSVVSVTKRERELNSNIGQTLYVVENTAIDGIIILQNEGGEIYSSTPTSSPEKIFDSLCDYIMSR